MDNAGASVRKEDNEGRGWERIADFGFLILDF
jgi:hypothetical protein